MNHPILHPGCPMAFIRETTLYSKGLDKQALVLTLWFVYAGVFLAPENNEQATVCHLKLNPSLASKTTVYRVVSVLESHQLGETDFSNSCPFQIYKGTTTTHSSVERKRLLYNCIIHHYFSIWHYGYHLSLMWWKCLTKMLKPFKGIFWVLLQKITIIFTCPSFSLI